MVNTAHLFLVASVVAACCVLATRASSISSPTRATILTIADTSKEEALMEAQGNAKSDPEAGAVEGGAGLFANNKIQIKDSRIVLTASDRKQLLRSIAKAMVADQAKANAADTAPSTSLLALNRDAFLYVKDDGAVRLGWRYPLATGQIYKDYMVTETCEVKSVIGDFYYC